jgi:GTP cyclohydrolase I
MTIEKILSSITPSPATESTLPLESQIDRIASNFSDILSILGMDLSDDSIKETPRRIAKMYVEEMFRGLRKSSFPKITTIENKMAVDEMVIVKGIKVNSVCEHHFQTIFGLATIAYIPKKKILGLSKFNRLVDFFCRRPQVQERLTKQISDCLTHVLETDDVAVLIDAKHFCVISRGIQDVSSSTVTTDLRGRFRDDPSCRSEFLRNSK